MAAALSSIDEWTLLIVTSERDNQIVVSVTQRIYKTENSTDQFETGVSKHFFPFMKEKTLYLRRKSPLSDHRFGPYVAHALLRSKGFS